MLKQYISLLALIVAVLLSLNFSLDSSDRCNDCYQEYLKVMRYYNKSDMQNVHMLYTSYAVDKGVLGRALTTEILQDRQKLHWKNELGAMYQDLTTSVLIAFDRKQIILQKSSLSTTAAIDWKKFSASYKIDTLKKYFKPIQCSADKRKGHINVEMKEDFKSQSILRSMDYDYDIQTGQMFKVDIRTELQGVVSREVMEIKKFITVNVGTPFRGSALSQVINGGKLKDTYKGYTLIDLRTTK